MVAPRGLNTYLRVVSKLRRIGEVPQRPTASGSRRDGWNFQQSWAKRPNGPLVWVQTRRVDDARWIAEYGRQLSGDRGEPINLLLTTEEATDFHPGQGVYHLPSPVESRRAATRFLQHWQPDLGLFLNAPSKPVLITAAHSANVPLFLAATRRAETQAKPRLPILGNAVLTCFARCLAASVTDAEALRKQGVSADRVEITGPLLDMSAPLPCDLNQHDELRAALAGRPVWNIVNASDDDIDTALRAHQLARRGSHRLILTIIPESTSTAALGEELKRKGWRVTDTDGLLAGDDAARIVLAEPEDRGLWYRVATITLTGGTFDDDREAADPFEPALLGSAVAHGPATAPYDARFRRLGAAGGALPLTDPDEIASAVEYLLAPDRAAEFAHAAWSVTSEAAPALDRLIALTHDMLDQAEAGA